MKKKILAFSESVFAALSGISSRVFARQSQVDLDDDLELIDESTLKYLEEGI